MLSNMGGASLVSVINIVLLAVVLFILYLIISAAVKNGINKSVVSQLIEKKEEGKENKESFLDIDLDNEK